MGYRGKRAEQEKARLLRAEGRTVADIAEMVGVSKSSVSLWVRGVEIEPLQRRPSLNRRPHPHPQYVAKLAEIEQCQSAAFDRVGPNSEQAFLAAGAALYAGEGSKTDGKVLFANTNSEMVAFFCAWLRRFFAIDEARLRARVYLHAGLDLDASEDHWSRVTSIPRPQFRTPYRAKPDRSIRHRKHEHGCVYVYYCCSRTHREVMGLVRALLASAAYPG